MEGLNMNSNCSRYKCPEKLLNQKFELHYIFFHPCELVDLSIKKRLMDKDLKNTKN